MEDQRKQEFYKFAKGYLLRELKKKECSFNELQELAQLVYKKLCKKDSNKWKDFYPCTINPVEILLDEINSGRVKTTSKKHTYLSLK